MLNHAFPPVATINSHTLILGSMPGVASLSANEYYAHPRNAFWPIMQRLLEFPSNAAYQKRLFYLQENGIALWDVIAACERSGSLDSSIRHESVQPNDFAHFFQQHTNVTQICFNGNSAANLFKRHVLAKHKISQKKSQKIPQKIPSHIRLQILPSTSPANARLSFEEKCALWLRAFS